MDTRFWLSQAFNGISYGALLFLVGSGLSLIFGVMRIVNLAHGSYFLLGSYVALSVIWTTGSWLLAIPAAAGAVGLLGLVMERVFLRPLGFDPLRQVLLTVGFALLFQQGAQGKDEHRYPRGVDPDAAGHFRIVDRGTDCGADARLFQPEP